MIKISPLDIRVAVFACLHVPKEEWKASTRLDIPLSPSCYDERIVSLYRKSPKTRLEPSKTPSLIRKSLWAMIRLFELMKAILKTKEHTNILSDIAPPRRLLVPGLPHPKFKTPRPYRFFWHPSYEMTRDEYTPGCLMSEAKEDLPVPVANSPFICAYARAALSQKGFLKQDDQGFVYLELSSSFITELFPLMSDEKCEAIPLDQSNPSSAHIPVIIPHEMSWWKGYREIQEKQPFAFTIQQLCSMKPKRWPGIEKVYFLKISSPQLEQFRRRNLLSPLIRGHEFHIAIAYTQEIEELKGASQKETYRLNVSCFAA